MTPDPRDACTMIAQCAAHQNVEPADLGLAGCTRANEAPDTPRVLAEPDAEYLEMTPLDVP